METKYLNWLIGQNWTINGPDEPIPPYHPKWGYTAESPAGLQVCGNGESAEEALDDLEANCKEWLTEIEHHLNMNFVEDAS